MCGLHALCSSFAVCYFAVFLIAGNSEFMDCLHPFLF